MKLNMLTFGSHSIFVKYNTAVASKLTPQQADEKFHQCDMQIYGKRTFLFLGLQLENEEKIL